MSFEIRFHVLSQSREDIIAIVEERFALVNRNLLKLQEYGCSQRFIILLDQHI